MSPNDFGGDDALLLEQMTWPQVQEAMERGYTTALVACGAVEQHGPHLPLLVDASHGTRLALEVAERLGNALVAPTVRVGCSDHHMAFPGTISLRPSTLEAVCRDYCTSLAAHGFSRVGLLPSHGGNFQVLADAVDRLDEAAGPHTRVIAFTDLVGVIDLWREVVEEEAGLGHRVGGHADVAESSITLHLHPELVDEERAASGYTAEIREDVLDRILAEGFDSVTENGILGDARGMSARVGERCISALADRMAEYLRAA